MAIHTTQGYQLQVNNGTAYINVGGVESISFGNGTAEEYDVTALSDTAKQKLTGFIDNGDMTASVFEDFADAGQDFLRAEVANSNTVALKIVLASTAGASNITFNGETKQWSHDFSRGPAKATFGAAVSGAITIA